MSSIDRLFQKALAQASDADRCMQVGEMKSIFESGRLSDTMRQIAENFNQQEEKIARLENRNRHLERSFVAIAEGVFPLDLAPSNSESEKTGQNTALNRHLLETMNEGFMLSDTEGVITYVNRRYCEIFRQEPQFFIGRKVIDLIHESQKIIYSQQLEQRKKGISSTYEQNILLSDGHRVYIIVAGSPIYENGCYTGNISIITDITTIKQANEKLERQTLMLEESQRLAHVGSFEHDLKTDNIVSSDEIYRIFGFNPDESHPSFQVLNTMFHPDDQSKMILHMQETVRTKHFEDFELRILRKDGTQRLVHVTGTVLTDADGSPSRILGCLQDITERRSEEQKLREFKFCVDQAPDAILWVNQDGSFSYVNQKACELLGYEERELVSLSLADLHEPYDKDVWDKRWEQYRQDGGVMARQVETVNRRKDGSWVPVEAAAKHVLFDDKALHVAFVRDISVRKKMEQRLQLTQRSIDKASIGCFWLDHDARFMYANEQTCQLLGYDWQELRGMSIFEVDSSSSKEQMNALLPKFNEQRTFIHEPFYKRKDGTLFPVENTITVIEHGGFLFTASFFQDISERRKVEENLRLTQFCFEKAMMGIFIIGSDSRILRVNEYGCASLGYSCDELCTMNLFGIACDFDANQWNELGDHLHQQRFILVNSVHRRKDGTTFPVEVMISLMDFQNEQLGIAFVRDISERKHAEEESARLNARLIQAQKMEALGTLAGGVAHDFNNILAAVMGYAELAYMFTVEGSNVRGYLEQLRIACHRARELVQQILVFSRMNTSEKIPIDIGAIVQEVLKLIRASIPANIDIQTNIPSNLGRVLANQTQVHQVVMNLCTNSYQSMKNNGGVLVVELTKVQINVADSALYTAIAPGRYLKLTVQDNGIGMDGETLERIFEPYFTTKQEQGGSGLGLSTVHGIVKDHGGAIKVYSEPGKGTVFHILFPITGNGKGHKTEESATLPTGREYILFVDDEKMVADIGEQILESLGYSVQAVHSSQDALDAMLEEPGKYDLLVTDMTMPKLSGDRLVEEIKKIRPDIPVILCTGFSEKMITGTLKELGVDTFLMKPFTAHELAMTVRKVLDFRQLALNGIVR